MMHEEDSTIVDDGVVDVDAPIGVGVEGEGAVQTATNDGAPSTSSAGIANGEDPAATEGDGGDISASSASDDEHTAVETGDAAIQQTAASPDPQDMPDQPPPSQQPEEAAPNNEVDPSVQKHSMEYNVALEALESMRRLNLEVEFSDITSAFPVDHEKCTYCQREALHKFITSPPMPEEGTAANGEVGISIGKVKLDGSRMRRFNSKMGSFFSKSSASMAGTEGDQSCASLASMESTGKNTSINESIANPRASRRNILKRKPRPCLTCGHPTCSSHASSAFSKNDIRICQPCAYLFELDFLVDVIASSASDTDQCRRKVDDMVDKYDRAKLLLEFTAQYAEEIATALESSTARSNKIGAGSSATGIGSGVLGVVGCGALLFPPVAAAGVPLLLASLVFGGGATAAQTADASVKYFSEPNKLAEKMVALHGMVLSLLRITEVLSYGLLKTVDVNYSLEGMGDGEGEEGADEDLKKREALAKEIGELLEKHGVTTTKSMGAVQTATTAGIVATEVAAASRIVATEAAAAGATAGVAGTEAAISTSAVVSTASTVGRGSRYFGRVGTTAASSARFIPIAGGLLSAACIYVEGKELKRTMSNIKEGNPCAKAEQVRTIKEELAMLPDSSVIAAECKRVFDLASSLKAKQAAVVDAANEGLKQVGDFAFVEQEDLSEMIGCMEVSAKAAAMDEEEGAHTTS
ncbi:hypothetical protein ACHAXT_006244 [Thalassiosira profunda]